MASPMKNVDSLSKKELAKLLKEQIRVQDQMQEEISTLKDQISNLQKSIDALTKQVTEKGENQDQKIQTNLNDGIKDRLTDIERRIGQQEQYSRHECVELVGAPNDIADDQLETS